MTHQKALLSFCAILFVVPYILVHPQDRGCSIPDIIVLLEETS